MLPCNTLTKALDPPPRRDQIAIQFLVPRMLALRGLMRARVYLIALLTMWGCTASGDDMTSNPAEDPPSRASELRSSGSAEIPIAAYRVPRDQLLKPGESASALRHDLIRQIQELYPELEHDPVLMPSLRGEASWIVLSVPVRYEKILPLAARAYQLLELERKQARRSLESGS